MLNLSFISNFHQSGENIKNIIIVEYKLAVTKGFIAFCLSHDGFALEAVCNFVITTPN
jgi:hypothetical protein